MIRRAEEMVKELKAQMRGGKGTVEINHIFQPGELKGKSRLAARVIINPGCSIGLHEHVDEEEIYYILKGTAKVEDGGKVSEVTVGDAVLTGGGAAHSIENIGSEPLEMVAVIILYS